MMAVQELEDAAPPPTPWRTFGSVAGALQFHLNRRERKLGKAISLEHGQVPRSDEDRARDELTDARIIGCLTRNAPEDWEPANLVEEEVDALAAFYEVTFAEYADSATQEAAKQKLASRLGTSWALLCTEVRRTRNVLRRRMVARGLVRS